MSEIAPVRIMAPGGVNQTKTSLFHSKLIISAPARISAQGFSGIYVVSMSLSGCAMSGCPCLPHDVYGCRVSADMSTPCPIKQLGPEGW